MKTATRNTMEEEKCVTRTLITGWQTPGRQVGGDSVAESLESVREERALRACSMLRHDAGLDVDDYVCAGHRMYAP